MRFWLFSFSPLPSCRLPKGSNYYVRILSTIDRELLKPNASVALHKHSNALVDVLPPEADSSIMMLTSGNGAAQGRGGPKGPCGPGWEPRLCSPTRPEARRDVRRHRGHGHPEAGGAGGRGAPAHALRTLQAGEALGGREGRGLAGVGDRTPRLILLSPPLHSRSIHLLSSSLAFCSRRPWAGRRRCVRRVPCVGESPSVTGERTDTHLELSH